MMHETIYVTALDLKQKVSQMIKRVELWGYLPEDKANEEDRDSFFLGL